MQQYHTNNNTNVILIKLSKSAIDKPISLNKGNDFKSKIRNEDWSVSR